jgi:uncharacterized phage protein (TIGR02220 family)
MKWFKHMTNMRHDVRIKRVIKKYGLKGYGLYNMIIESIAESLTNDEPLPDLEENAQDIAEYFGEDTIAINEMMAFMFNQGLFSQDEVSGRLLCDKIYKFFEKSQTRSLEMRQMIDKFKKLSNENTCPILSETVTDFPDNSDRIDKNRIDIEYKEEERIKSKPLFTIEDVKETKETIEDMILPKPPLNNDNKTDEEEKRKKEKTSAQKEKKKKDVKEVIDYLNEKCGKRFTYSKKTNLVARLDEGYSVDDCKQAIDNKLKDKFFIDNPQYYNPTTLFRPTHFENYLNEVVIKQPTQQYNYDTNIVYDSIDMEVKS